MIGSLNCGLSRPGAMRQVGRVSWRLLMPHTMPLGPLPVLQLCVSFCKAISRHPMVALGIDPRADHMLGMAVSWLCLFALCTIVALMKLGSGGMAASCCGF